MFRVTTFRTDSVDEIFLRCVCNLFVYSFCVVCGFTVLFNHLQRLNEPRHREPDFCLCENKGADQLPSNCEADQRLCFRYTDSTTTLLSRSKFSSFCDCTGQFVLDLVGNPKTCFRGSNDSLYDFMRKLAFLEKKTS